MIFSEWKWQYNSIEIMNNICIRILLISFNKYQNIHLNLRVESIPIIFRTNLGPHEDISKIYVMNKQTTSEIR